MLLTALIVKRLLEIEEIYNIAYTAIKKIGNYKKFVVWILCIYMLIAQADISKKSVNKYLIFDSLDENK